MYMLINQYRKIDGNLLTDLAIAMMVPEDSNPGLTAHVKECLRDGLFSNLYGRRSGRSIRIIAGAIGLVMSGEAKKAIIITPNYYMATEVMKLVNALYPQNKDAITATSIDMLKSSPERFFLGREKVKTHVIFDSIDLSLPNLHLSGLIKVINHNTIVSWFGDNQVMKL